jgi:hypothetical protein
MLLTVALGAVAARRRLQSTRGRAKSTAPVRADRGRLLEDFVFEVGIGGKAVTLLRDGFVTDEFLDLARSEHRTEPPGAATWRAESATGSARYEHTGGAGVRRRKLTPAWLGNSV